MKKNLFYAILLLLCLGTTQGFSQTELKGKVSDFMTFMPIENANVYLENTTIGSITNSDGRFSLRIPEEHALDTLVISSIGYVSYRMAIPDYENGTDIYLEEAIASLDEVVLVADTRPKTGNEIMIRALERLENNIPDTSYIQKGFLRHKERNKNEYKWLIEAAITMYDANQGNNARNDLKINVDEIRKSYDLRDVDSIFTYTAYLNSRGQNIGANTINRRNVKTNDLIHAIRWNDQRINGLANLFEGKLNLFRNINASGALFGKSMLENHHFELDTILVDNGRKIYKINIEPGSEYVGLNTPNIYNEGFHPDGVVYIYYDNYAIKKIEYDLLAASDIQKTRSKSLFDTHIIHRLIMNFIDINDKMYLNYIYYETPKLVNIGDRSSEREKTESAPGFDKGAQFYYTIQEIIFTDIINDQEEIKQKLQNKSWTADLFQPKPYNEAFWKNYNVLLESEEEEKLIQDLTRRASLFKE